MADDVRIQFAMSTPRCDVVAIVDPAPATADWVRTNISPDLPVLRTPEDLYARYPCPVGGKPSSGALDAVVISTETAFHATLACDAIGRGVHVLLEKPISIDAAGDEQVLAASKARPDVRVVVALSRRFDASYRAAFDRLQSGELGEAFLVKSATVDQYDESGWFVPYSLKSGGIFIDCGIHDIDIARWMLGLSDAQGVRQRSLARVKRCFAIGYNALHPELGRYGDADNATGVVQLTDGRSFTFNLGRTAIHGHECSCEIIGTKGRVFVNQNPAMNRVQILDGHGVRTESTPTYFERFEQAFVTEAREFVAGCLDGADMCVTLNDAVEAARIATGLTYAVRSGEIVDFDQKTGKPIPPRGLVGSTAGTAIVDSQSKL